MYHGTEAARRALPVQLHGTVYQTPFGIWTSRKLFSGVC